MGSHTPPSLLQRLSSAALDALAPHLCPLCGTELEAGNGACAPCLDTLSPAPFPNELTAKLAASGTNVAWIERIAARWTFTLDSPVQELIHGLKYYGLRPLARQMGRQLGLMLEQFPEFAAATVVVPVPLHRSRLRERGYNQAAEIAAGIADVHQRAQMEELLLRRTATRTQTRLDATARSRNVAEAFALREPLRSNDIYLLCDDVFTTGATLGACAATLHRAGAVRVLAATLAYDDPSTQ